LTGEAVRCDQLCVTPVIAIFAQLADFPHVIQCV